MDITKCTYKVAGYTKTGDLAEYTLYHNGSEWEVKTAEGQKVEQTPTLFENLIVETSFVSCLKN